MNAEITWDLVMSEDMPFAEGCYRIDGGDWQVVTAIRAGPDRPAGVRNGVKWDSGVTGLKIVFPKDTKINRASLAEAMSEVLGIDDWREVSGPDSMGLIADPVEFTPATSTRRFSLAAPEHIVVGQLSDVLPDLIAEAPKARFEISSVLAPLPELLDSGSLDLALTTLYADETLKLESAMMRSQLFAERFVCIGRRGHPLLTRGCIELAAFLGAPQISIRMPGARTSPTDTALENEGLARHVALTLGSAHAAAQYVGNSDLLAMVPYSVAARGEALGRLTCVAPPIKLPPVTGMLWWSNRLHSDPAHRWWREKLGRLLQPINYGDRSK